MRKCFCTVLHNQNYLYKIHINFKLSYIDIDINKKYHTFYELYTAVLQTLKNNNFYTDKWQEFNTTFYNINFIDTDEYIICRYGYI